MIRSLKFALLLFALLLALPAARAATTCTSVGSPTLSAYYVEQSTTKVQGVVTVRCTRTGTGGGNPPNITYSIWPDDGDYANSGTNRARAMFLWVIPVYLRYDLFRDASCGAGAAWTSQAPINGAMTWAGSATGTQEQQHTFWLCMTPQNVSLDGTYTDQVQLNLRWNSNNTGTISSPMNVNITAPASCSIERRPGEIRLDYTAFGPEASGTTTFQTRCTSGMPYDVTTEPAAGVISGVRYFVTVQQPNGTGTGAPATHTIRATAPAGQAGQCGTGTCTGRQTHQLVITY